MNNVPNIHFTKTGQQYANLNWKKKNKGRHNLVKTNKLIAIKDHHFYNILLPDASSVSHPPTAKNSSSIVTFGDKITLKCDSNSDISGNNNQKYIYFDNSGNDWGLWKYGDSLATGIQADNYNKTNISARGNYSLAMGRNTEASGNSSLSVGIDSKASRDYSVAWGINCDASGLASFAVGKQCDTSFNIIGSIATGKKGTTLKTSATQEQINYLQNDGGGDHFPLLFCIGYDKDNNDISNNIFELDATGDLWLANQKPEGFVNLERFWHDGSGNSSMYSDNYNTTNMKVVGNYSISIGESNQIDGSHTFVGGGYNDVSGNYNLVFGKTSQITNTETTNVMGGNHDISGVRTSNIIGIGNKLRDISASFINGFQNDVSANACIIFGEENEISHSSGSIAFGIYNHIDGKQEDTNYNRNNIVIGRAHKITDGSNCTAIGCNNRVAGFASAAFGRDTEASGNYATTFGINTTATGEYSVSMGKDCSSIELLNFSGGENNIARGPSGGLILGRYNVLESTGYVGGSGNTLNAHESMIYGESNQISPLIDNFLNLTDQSQCSITFGFGNYIYNRNCSCFGEDNQIKSNDSTAFGFKNLITHDSYTPTGSPSTTGDPFIDASYGKSSFIFGASNNIQNIRSVVGGFNNICKSQFSFIGGRENGVGCCSRSNFSFIFGNKNISKADGLTIEAPYKFIVGISNESWSAVTLVSGYNNRILDGSFSVLLGGQNNVVDETAPYSFIGGGILNKAQSPYSGIFGGKGNTAFAFGQTTIQCTDQSRQANGEWEGTNFASNMTMSRTYMGSAFLSQDSANILTTANNIYLVGGQIPESNSHSLVCTTRTTEIYNIDNNKWEILTNLQGDPLFTNIAGSGTLPAAAIVGDYLYIAGGAGHAAGSVIPEIPPSTNSILIDSSGDTGLLSSIAVDDTSKNKHIVFWNNTDKILQYYEISGNLIIDISYSILNDISSIPISIVANGRTDGSNIFISYAEGGYLNTLTLLPNSIAFETHQSAVQTYPIYISTTFYHWTTGGNPGHYFYTSYTSGADKNLHIDVEGNAGAPSTHTLDISGVGSCFVVSEKGAGSQSPPLTPRKYISYYDTHKQTINCLINVNGDGDNVTFPTPPPTLAL